jgi:hypothetical protein
MASVYDYSFYNNTSRIGDDLCDQSQQTVQNSQFSTYMLNNFRTECPMSSAIDFATNQLAVNYSGSHQVGIGGCNIDDSSSLLKSGMTRPKCRLDLNPRTFTTVPFLGKGRSNPVLESQLIQGDFVVSRKGSNIGETDITNYQYVPMLAALKATVTNPANLVEGVAAEGWVRGGVPSRLLIREKDYDNTGMNCSYKY